ncbi:MAG: ABC transporter ATP-binding protein [Rhizobiales bacterium]|nr:ABC transporter ATP-binding protein [Hyphomicrobiales bacterium]
MSERFDLELRTVEKQFGDQTVVRGVSFALEKGEFLSLLGPSGCGKTTTLSMIAGFEAPSGGEILIRGRRIDALPPEKRDIGMVFQNYALFPHLTVADNIGFGLRMRGVRKAEARTEVESSARLVKVNHLLDRYPRQLSGGQQQRVALARALVTKPALVLLDEPFGALDRLLREELQIEIRSLLRRLNITTVFVTHDQDEALSMSDRVAVMFDGRIEQISTPQQLYLSPATRNVAGFIGKGTFLRGNITANGVFETRLGAFKLASAAAARKAVVGDYFLRPESVFVTARVGQYPNEINAEVAAMTFLGDRQTLIADAPDGTRFFVQVRHDSPALAIGSKVRLGWGSESATVYQSASSA